MTANQFTDIYKKLSDAKLLDIIDNKQDYQKLAVDTALFELQSRQLTDQQLDLANQKNQALKTQKNLADKKNNQRVELVKNTADKTLSLFDPFIEKAPNKIIIIICIVFGTLALFKIISNFYFIRFTLLGELDWDKYSTLIFLDVLFLPVTLIFVWKKMQIGRILLILYSSLNGAMTIPTIFLILTTHHTDSPLANLFPTPNLSAEIFGLSFNLGLVYYLCKRQTRELFDKKTTGTNSA